MHRLLAMFYDNRILAYLLPIASITVITAGLVLVREQMESATVALLYFLPVGACAAIGGLGPGILAAVIAFFSLNYFFISPYGTLLVHQSQDIIALVVFLILAIIISQLVGRLIRSLATARARENETTRLYELSQSISKYQKPSEILEKLAQLVLENFLVETVEINVKTENQSYSIFLPAEEGTSPGTFAKPTTAMPLLGSQHLTGEIRLWRQGRSFRPAEEQLLRAYAHQLILALERIILAEQVNQAELLKATEKLQSSLLNSISHDLRTPLVSITGALSSLTEKSLSLDQEARESLLETAVGEAERLNRLVGNLLNMTRLEAGAMRIHKEPCDLQEIIGSAIGQLGDRINNRVIRVNMPAETGLIPLDMGLFEQVMVNVLDNAVKYSPPETVIEINITNHAGWTRIDICDRGEGIPREDLERVFDKFFRVQRPHKMGGSGLGLAICKGIVEAHEGQIQAKNRDGGGTIISILLPRESLS